MKETSTVLAMGKTTALLAMEVTAEEMEEVLKRRETKAKEAAIKEKADEIARLIDDIKRLGGRVPAQRDGKRTYFSTCKRTTYYTNSTSYCFTFSFHHIISS